MVRKIGIQVESIFPEIHLTEFEKDKVKSFRRNALLNNEKFIGINVSSGNSAPNLNQSECKKLILLLKENQNYKVAIMDNEIPKQLHNIDGVIYPNKGNVLRDSIISLASLDILISNSTGTMHICAALKVSTISLFCPLTACSPNLWGPLGNKSEIILPKQSYCDTQCPIDPKECDYSKEGGLKAEFILERINSFIQRSN